MSTRSWAIHPCHRIAAWQRLSVKTVV